MCAELKMKPGQMTFPFMRPWISSRCVLPDTVTSHLRITSSSRYLNFYYFPQNFSNFLAKESPKEIWWCYIDDCLSAFSVWFLSPRDLSFQIELNLIQVKSTLFDGRWIFHCSHGLLTIFSSFFISLVMSMDFLLTFFMANTRPL